MTTKRLVDVDITDRDDGKLPAWSDADSTHVYVSPLVDPTTTRGDVLVRGASALGRVALAALGKVLVGDGTDAVADYPPGHELDYAQITSPVSVTGNGSPTFDTIVTGAGFTSDGSAVMVECYAYALEPSNAAAARNINLWLFLDGSLNGLMAYAQTPAAAVLRVPALARRKITPSSGSRTFAIKATVNGGTGTVHAGSGGGSGGMPCYIRVTKA